MIPIPKENLSSCINSKRHLIPKKKLIHTHRYTSMPLDCHLCHRRTQLANSLLPTTKIVTWPEVLQGVICDHDTGMRCNNGAFFSAFYANRDLLGLIERQQELFL